MVSLVIFNSAQGCLRPESELYMDFFLFFFLALGRQEGFFSSVYFLEEGTPLIGSCFSPKKRNIQIFSLLITENLKAANRSHPGMNCSGMMADLPKTHHLSACEL